MFSVHSLEHLYAFEFMKKHHIKASAWTIPLKSIAHGLVETSYSPLRVVNTVLLEKGYTKGFNTDVVSITYLLSQSSSEKNTGISKALIIGSGSTAESAIWSARSLGMDVYCYARNSQKVEQLTTMYSVKPAKVAAYDVVILATSSVEGFAVWKYIRGVTVFLDVRLEKSKELEFAAIQYNATVYSGYEMFTLQAAEQFSIWFGLDTAVVNQFLSQLLELSQ